MTTWIVARHRLAVDIPATLWLWGIYAAIVAAVAVAIANVGGITGSVWEPASQVARWFAGAIGASLTWSSLPLYVTHGFTRRVLMTQMPVVIVVFAGALAVLMTIGFAVETAVYGALDWPQALSRTHLFGSPDQLTLVLAEFWLSFVVWTVAGALVAAGFYRNTGLGLVLIPVGLVLVTVVEYAVGPGYLVPPVFGVVSRAVARVLVGVAPDGGSLPTAAATCAGTFALGMALTWAVVHDIPVRNRAA